MNMECLYTNYFNTTTVATVTSGTSTVANLFDRRTDKYQSSGDSSDLTTTSIRVDFTTFKEVDRIILQNLNFKSFRIYYNSLTSNLFSITSALTGTTSWTGNSETSLYLILADTKTISSIIIEATATMIANSEKELRELWFTGQQYVFVDNPSAKDYKPIRKRQEYLHTMSDGGTTQYILDEKFEATIKRTFVSPSETSELADLYFSRQTLVFTPNPTGTSWDNSIYEVNWIGNWDFDQYSHDYKGNGYSGNMRFRETPS